MKFFAYAFCLILAFALQGCGTSHYKPHSGFNVLMSGQIGGDNAQLHEQIERGLAFSAKLPNNQTVRFYKLKGKSVCRLAVLLNAEGKMYAGYGPKCTRTYTKKLSTWRDYEMKMYDRVAFEDVIRDFDMGYFKLTALRGYEGRILQRMKADQKKYMQEVKAGTMTELESMQKMSEYHINLGKRYAELMPYVHAYQIAGRSIGKQYEKLGYFPKRGHRKLMRYYMEYTLYKDGIVKEEDMKYAKVSNFKKTPNDNKPRP